MSYVVECPSCGHESEQVYRCDDCGRDLETFISAVDLWLARRDGTLREGRRERCLRHARRLKIQGEQSDQGILRRIIQRTRDKDLPE